MSREGLIFYLSNCWSLRTADYDIFSVIANTRCCLKRNPSPQPGLLQDIFSSTTRFGKLNSVFATVSGRNLFIRFTCETSDAMGMNMVGKGVNKYVYNMATNIAKSCMIAPDDGCLMDYNVWSYGWTSDQIIQ